METECLSFFFTNREVITGCSRGRRRRRRSARRGAEASCFFVSRPRKVVLAERTNLEEGKKEREKASAAFSSRVYYLFSLFVHAPP
jgi:hypothetical protein